MKWTHDPPTKQGNYLLRYRYSGLAPWQNSMAVVVYQVAGPDGNFHLMAAIPDRTQWVYVLGANPNTQWAGPIPEPEDNE